MADLTAGGVPVYLDSIGVVREKPGQPEIDALKAELEANQRTFAEYGGGFVDYSDADLTAGITTPLPTDKSTQITRNLVASGNNSRLNRPFAEWQPWDNAAKLVRARALYDVIGIRADIGLIPDKVGGVVRVSLMTPTIELAGKNMPLTVRPGVEEKISVDFPELAVRSSFFANGAMFVLTPTVPMTLIEFSPEFYPLGYEA